MKDWTILEILNWTREHFQEKKIENARLNAELLITHVLNLKRLELYMNFDQVVSRDDRETIKQMLIRRAKNEPLQYILGETEFYGYKFKVNSSVLIPRPETELLVEKVLENADGIRNVLEIGTGSGCIAITLAKELELESIDAVDISPETLLTAKKNAEFHKVKINFFRSDLFSEVTSQYDLIISNPPYISKTDFEDLPLEIQKFEPRSALLAPEEGLYFYRKILEDAGTHLKENGKIYFEIGHDQKDRIKLIAEKNGFMNIEFMKDLNGYDRIMLIGR